MAEGPEANVSPNHKKLVDPRLGSERGENPRNSLVWDVRNSLYVDPGRSVKVKKLTLTEVS